MWGFVHPINIYLSPECLRAKDEELRIHCHFEEERQIKTTYKVSVVSETIIYRVLRLLRLLLFGNTIFVPQI